MPIAGRLWRVSALWGGCRLDTVGHRYRCRSELTPETVRTIGAGEMDTISKRLTFWAIPPAESVTNVVQYSQPLGLSKVTGGDYTMVSNSRSLTVFGDMQIFWLARSRE